MLQLIALCLSLLFEIPLILLLLKGSRFMQSLTFFQRVLWAAVPTLITHPFLWMASARWFSFIAYGPRILLLESGVVLLESVLLRLLFRLPIIKALLVSLLVNTVSTLLGLLLWRLIL